MISIIVAVLVHILPACASEDSSNCYWNASARGNHQGVSFIDIGGRVYYVKGK